MDLRGGVDLKPPLALAEVVQNELPEDMLELFGQLFHVGVGREEVNDQRLGRGEEVASAEDGDVKE